MVNIRLEGDTRAALNKIRGLAEMDRKSLNAALGQGVRASTLERFRTGKGPDGRRWPTSKRALAEGGRTLVDSGQARNSIQVRSDATGFAVGTNVKHASTHQYGVRNRIIKAKNKKYLRFKVDGRWITRKKVKVTIPARPFLGLSAEDQTESQETVEDFIRRQGNSVCCTQAKAYLVGKLKEAGLKTKPYTTMKSLSRSLESHVGAVLPGTEMIARNGSKTIYQDQEGAQRQAQKALRPERDVSGGAGRLYGRQGGGHAGEIPWPLWTRGSKWTETSSPGRGERGVVHRGRPSAEGGGRRDGEHHLPGGVYRDIGLHRARTTDWRTSGKTMERSLQMAIKNNRLQDAAPDAASLEDIETLRARYGVSRPVFVGVCSANGWRRGRQMTAADFLVAVEVYQKAPMTGGRKEA